MENSNSIWYVTIILSAVAGFCDTVTFVAAGSIFSAHVTGNFIVFAYQIINGTNPRAWIKLLSFPFFVAAVITGGQIGSEPGKRYRLLFIEGVLLLVSGIFALFVKFYSFAEWGIHLTAMMTVFAMGLQNAFGKLYAKETYGPTTMMTGNVTQASLDLGSLLFSSFKNIASAESIKKQGITITGFLTGCLIGALLAKNFGLYVLIAPGLLLVICYLSTARQAGSNLQ
ncbi:YoaK family protein [Mucilaginibacter endophyticus]|uniref:YoaK family protein n=1 Tax=Mucilaginibacter endophyticus TaxID=2675003 RepID=UPI000E0D0164|nr:YoaK family protein [Mucilaginibacter endophyticus]